MSDPSQMPPADGTPEAEPQAEQPPTIRLRTTRSLARLDHWTLVLQAKGIGHLLRWVEEGFELHVPPEAAVFAGRELDATDAEEREAWRRAAREAVRRSEPVHPLAASGAFVLIGWLVAFFARTGPHSGASLWARQGASDASLVLGGEPWRALTALTLHSDWAHLLSNAALGWVVSAAVMRRIGVGWGAALVVGSGVAGNLLNAVFHGRGHLSIGFSTAVFGAIGLLGGLAWHRARADAHRHRPAWTSLAGAAALLALMGTDARSDVLAHLFGALAGMLIGLVVGLRRRMPGAWEQWILGLGTALAVSVAWRLALMP